MNRGATRFRLVRHAACGCVFGLALLLHQAGGTQPQTTVSGRVLFSDSQPVEGALVRIQTTENLTYTDGSGNFVLGRTDEPDDVAVTAWKHNYYSVGVRTTWGDHYIELVLEPYYTTDNPDYEWMPARGEDGCTQCHAATIIPQWENNLHSQSATNILVRTVYSGTDVHGNPEETLGYRHDFPGNPGNCAACHVPGAAANDPYGVFLDEVTGVNADGVHCDFCHKIYDATVPAPGMPGVLSIELRRPAQPGRDLFFGPFDDDIEGEDSFLPLQTKSEFCAPCHMHESWGVPIYQSFPEWFNSPYRTMGVECQNCHNVPDGKISNIAPHHPDGVPRDPARVPSHNMMGEDRQAFIASSITMEVDSEVLSDRFRVTVSVTNSGVGHHFPTGQPMRNVILVVSATDGYSHDLPLLHGDEVPEYGGDLAGRTGRLYAKILEELPTNYPDQPSRPLRMPCPQWMQTRIQSDTRIAAFATDESQYDFAKPDQGIIRLEVNLIYRRAFSKFAQIKGWDIPDVPVAHRAEQLALFPDADTDGDGLTDGEELDVYSSDPMQADTDGDGLTDWEEVWYDGSGDYDPYHPSDNLSGSDTDVLNADTDGDGFADGREVARLSDPIDPGSLPPSRGGSGAPCFVTTAAYGTAAAKEVGVLRDFRDRYLLTNRVGSAFVRAYYQLSPPLAKLMEGRPLAKKVVRAGLLPVVILAGAAVDSPGVFSVVFVLVTALFVSLIALSVSRVRHRLRTGRS